MVSTEPVAPTIDVTALIERASAQAGWDTSLTGRGLLSAEQTSKVLCGLSQQVDKSVVTAFAFHFTTKITSKVLHKIYIDFYVNFMQDF